MTQPAPTEGYDRAAASRVLAELAYPGPFPPSGPVDAAFLGGAREIRYKAAPLQPEPGSHLTAAQLSYLDRFMQPCPADQVTSAVLRLTWRDSEGTPNVGHCGPSGLGPVVPVAARETILALWRALAASDVLAARIARLPAAAAAVLDATTTDREPMEIFRIGVEAAARTLVQHAYIAGQTPHCTPAAFARALAGSGLYGVVASTWYWELQASTFRRGMIPVSLAAGPDGTLRYPAATVAVLRAMKETTIAQARAVMARATGPEGLTVPQAVQKYYHDLDLIARQYALLPADEQPRCLGQMTHFIGGQRFSVLPGLAEVFTATFIAMLDLVRVTREPGSPDEPITDPAERTFHIPDMNCKHCRATITGLLESLGIAVADIDLVSKRIVAGFPTTAAREQAFEAIRDAGYTVVPPAGGP